MIGFDDIESASHTDVGMRRSHNQDAHASLAANELEQFRQRGHVFLVADGMGAHAVGELASKIAADTIPHVYSKYSQDGPVAALKKAFVEANATIHNRGQQNKEFAGMGTTATAICLRPEGAWVGHVGDSRAYRVRAGKIEQLSFDHSLVWELARKQRKNPEEMRGVPSNIIVRSLGPEPQVNVDVEGPHPLKPGDVFLLCSDGLSGQVSDREIGAVCSVLTPHEACRFLVHLANVQGGPDNITVVVAKVAGHSTDPLASSDAALVDFASGRRWGVPWPLLAMFAGIALAMLAIYQTAFNVPGEKIVFLLAAVCLLAGMAGLIFPNFRSTKPETPDKPRKVKIYRQTRCAIDQAMLDRLGQAANMLEQRIRDQSWKMDWDGYQDKTKEVGPLAESGDLKSAFAEQCRAMLMLMDAIAEQRGREEAFKPLWDKPVG